VLAPGGEGVLVTMEVRPGLDMPVQPAVVLAPASLFGDWQASIISMPSMPDLEFTTVALEGVLPGATLPDITELTAVGARIAEDLETLSERVELAFTEETALDIRETVENVQQISEQLTGFVAEQTRTFDQVSQNVLTASANIEQTTARVDQVATQFEQAIEEGELQAIVRNARLASENLRELTAQLDTVTNQVPGLINQLEVTLNTAGRVVAQLEPATAEIAPTIVEARTAINDLQALLTEVRDPDGTVGRLLEDPALYEETQAAIATLRRVLADLQANPERYIGAIQIF
jgi:phospholipid/cholesterol/gamma-HCH transport system substrate-binding protein